MSDHLKTWLHAILWLNRHWRGQYPADEASVIAPHVAPGDICVDIGAHAGSWTRPLSRMVPHGKVYAFEALPYYAQALSRLMLLGFHRNVVVVNAAVSDKPGSVQIAWRTKAGRRLTGNTHVATDGEHNEVECVSVEAITLDDWSKQLPGPARVSFLKIDVEGAELLVLRGARNFLQKHRPVIFMEIVTESCARYGHTPADLFQLFEQSGYNAYTVHPDQDEPSSPQGARYPGKGLRPDVSGRHPSPGQAPENFAVRIKNHLRPSNAGNYPGHGDVMLIPAQSLAAGSP